MLLVRPLAAVLGLLLPAAAFAQGTSLRFYGNGVNDIDRVKIRIDDPANSLPGPPADVGGADFTIEYWMKASAPDNPAGAVSCGANINWIFGNIVFDRDRYNQDRKFGLSLAAGRVVFGVSGNGTGDRTICGTASVLDGQWHHVAVERRRSDGWMWLFVDGLLQAQADGPDGDVSYPDDGVPGPFCGGPCTNSDPFLVMAAEKHDAGASYPSYRGWLDEVRLSTVIRYAATFPRPTQPFAPDASTAALYHLDEGTGDAIGDSSGAAGGPSDGVRKYGGTPPGPDWSTDTPFGPTTADLSMVKTGPISFSPAATLTYALTVTNNGPADAANVQVNDATPPGLTFVSNAGACTTAFPCGLGLVPAGQGRTITATFLVPSGYGGPDPIVNTGSVTTTTSDPVSANDSASASTPRTVATSIYTLNPCRVIDTRSPDGPWGGPALAAGATRTFAIAGRCAIPLTARAVSLNVGVTSPTAAGNLRLYPTGSTPPLASAINYAAGQTRANNAVVALSAAGELDVRCSQGAGTVHLILDVSGWFE